MVAWRVFVFCMLQATADVRRGLAAEGRETVALDHRAAEDASASLWERYFVASTQAEALKERMEHIAAGEDHEALEATFQEWQAAQEDATKFWDLFAAAEEFAGGLRDAEEDRLQGMEMWLANSTTLRVASSAGNASARSALMGHFEGHPDSFVDFAERLGGGVLGGPDGFSVAFTARWDALNRWSRVVDFGNGARGDNILVANEKDTDALAFHVYGNGTNACLTIPGGIAQSKASRYLCSIDASGHMRVFRDGKLIGEKKHGLVPAAVPREHLYIGRSNFEGNAMFVGDVGNVCVWNSEAHWEDTADCNGAHM